eukprot:gene5732-7129_t
MQPYNIHFEFDQAGLASLSQAHQKVCIVKSVDDKVGNVVWLTFRPFQANTVTFTETYGLYASSQKIQQGTVLTRLSDVKVAQNGYSYPFNSSGFFDPASGRVDKGFGVKNNYGESLTFGLTQTANVNGSIVNSEINAAIVPNNLLSEFIPNLKVRVFVAANFDSGSIITSTISNGCDIDFTDSTTQSVRYDSRDNMFVPN